MGKGGGTDTDAQHILLYFINYFCTVLVGSSPRLGSYAVLFSVVVHFYCISCFIYQYVCSIFTAQLK